MLIDMDIKTNTAGPILTSIAPKNRIGNLYECLKCHKRFMDFVIQEESVFDY